MLPRLYCDFPLRADAMIALSEASAHHALRVLRLGLADELVLFDGAGGEYPGHIAETGRRCIVRTGSWLDLEREARVAVTLVQCLVSTEKMDWIVQKAVELGACRIVPVESRRSVVRLDAARAERRVQHWQRLVLAACEQCGRNRVPEVAAVQPLPEYFAQATAVTQPKLMLEPQAVRPLGAEQLAAGQIILLVGPEGGLDETEIAMARQAGFAGVRLGTRVLRTETAGCAGLAAVHALAGDL
ncbi:MAG: 16S rRNA (uracil(1498)-N(3))-methyltransferase [Rhodocyclaceae bacterium]|nr:16S rRNA (uracil(1498)-N(3))-methyltransferase [Rhodocyclaceae bacterium]MBX3667114.1 16S rRNA (uracil(1498)-N(3))-methyltransferase [Rhodocyclaceae bacterium]